MVKACLRWPLEHRDMKSCEAAEMAVVEKEWVA